MSEIRPRRTLERGRRNLPPEKKFFVSFYEKDKQFVILNSEASGVEIFEKEGCARSLKYGPKWGKGKIMGQAGM